jgi:hypothetical protein
MDRAPGRIRVHEHAETGKPLHPSDEDLSPGVPVPLAVYKLHTARRIFRGINPRPDRARRMCRRQRWNGLNHMDGHKLSANGLPYRTACSACWSGTSPWFAALRGRPWLGHRNTSDSRFIPTAHPLSFRPRASPSHLAVSPGRQSRRAERYDGKGNLYLQHAA